MIGRLESVEPLSSELCPFMDTFSALIALAFSRATTDGNFMGYRNPDKDARN